MFKRLKGLFELVEVDNNIPEGYKVCPRCKGHGEEDVFSNCDLCEGDGFVDTGTNDD